MTTNQFPTTTAPALNTNTVYTEDAPNGCLNLTFISIHDLTPEARVLYSSESIVDVLGYTPDEVVNRSIWDFFPPEDVPFAQSFHNHGVEADKAAMLVYTRVKDSTGTFVGCECCFTIVYDVIVVCTSIYTSGSPSKRRAQEAPVIRRMFASSPRDPRYHMLSHISHKFQKSPKPDAHEPRAALFLNRFTRTLTIMYATNGVNEILGISAGDLQGKSFYYCIAENCLQEAIRCLENAKGNDSIAYLRFWFRDPRIEGPRHNVPEDSDEEMATDSCLDAQRGGRVVKGEQTSSDESPLSPADTVTQLELDNARQTSFYEDPQSRTSSGNSLNPSDTQDGIFGSSLDSDSSASSQPYSPANAEHPATDDAVELEAVISCASDGLVVCLRRARPIIPQPSGGPYSGSKKPAYRNGLFAAPWADEPLLPPVEERSQQSHTAFAPSLGPQAARPALSASGPDSNDFMNAIRDQAIFAWALVGINGSLHNLSMGTPRGESIPTMGIPVWKTDHATFEKQVDGMDVDQIMSDGRKGETEVSPGHNGNDATGNDHRGIFGDPGIRHARGSSQGDIVGGGLRSGGGLPSAPGQDLSIVDIEPGVTRDV